MHKYLVPVLGLAILSVLLFPHCTKPTLVGSELVDLDQTPLERADTFYMEFRSFEVDSFETYRRGAGLQTGRYPLGFVEDPFFGTSRTTFYLEFVPSYGFSEPEFAGATLDSLILCVAADTAFLTGTPADNPTLSVYRLDERLPETVLYSNRTFPFDPQPVASYTGPIWPVPTYTSVEYGSTGAADTLTRPQYRFRIDDALAQEIMALDSTRLVVDSLFLRELRGFALAFSTPGQAWIGMLFNNGNTHLTLYYTDAGGIRRQARWLPVSQPIPPGVPRVAHLHQSTDRQTARYPALLTMNQSSDTVHFLQGMAGMEVEVLFPHLPSQELILVNHAVLEVGICALDGEDPSDYGLPEQLEIYTFGQDGQRVLIDDVIFAAKSGTFGLQNFFGGVPVVADPSGRMVYRFNLSAQVQRILEARTPPQIYIRVRNAANSPRRVVLCGAGSAHPPRLTITYTRLNP